MSPHATSWKNFVMHPELPLAFFADDVLKFVYHVHHLRPLFAPFRIENCEADRLWRECGTMICTMPQEWNDPLDEALKNAAETLDPPMYKHSEVERIKQNWFVSGYLFGVGTIGLIWWLTKSN